MAIQHLRMMNLVLLSLFVHLATASIDTSVCSQPAAPAPTYQRPILPPTFEVHIECIIVDKNLTTEVHELYDQDTNQGKLRQAIDGTHFTAYYNYATNEFLGVYPETRQCSVSDLSTSDQRFLLGYNATGLPKGEGRIYSAAAALHFGGAMERYIGKDAIRGINVDKWYSCQYWPGLDASMKVTWYFSDPNTWNMALALDAIPVRAWVKGKVGKDGESAPHNFEHYYDFMHFKPYIEHTDSFETPSFVTCPGRLLTKAMPRIPPTFSFGIEILDEIGEEVSYMKEWYDNIMKLTKYVYTPTIQISDGRFGYRPLTEIHDFNTGIAYIIDNQLGNCTFQTIEQSSFDDVNKDPFHVRIRTAQEFFYMNTSGVTYEGIKNTRGIPADVYVARRTDFPPGAAVNSTFEWYFKTNDYTFVQDLQSTFPGGHPLAMRIDMLSSTTPRRYTYNIYNYVRSPADIIHWDVSPCYLNRNRRKFQFLISGVYKPAVYSDRNQFKYQTMQALSYYARVNQLRIAGLKVAIDKNIQVRFELLDIAPTFGDVTNKTKETPLATAASTIANVINNGRLVIILYRAPRTRPLTVTSMQSSMVELVEGSTPSTSTTTTNAPTTRKYVTPKPPVTIKRHTNPNVNPFTNPTFNPFTNKPTTKPTARPTQKHVTRNPNPVPTYALRFCNTPASGYSGGVAVGVSAVMMVLGGCMGLGVAIYLKRSKRRFFNLE